MNFKKNVLASIFIGLGMPLATLTVDLYQPASGIVLRHIDQDNVLKARQDYEEEIPYAAPVQWGLSLSATALVALCAYKYYWRNSETLSARLLATDDQQRVVVANAKLTMENIRRIRKLEAVQPEYSFAYRFAAGTWDMGMMLVNGGALSLGAAFLVSPVVQKIINFKNSLPDCGDLNWYINNRVKDYGTDFTALMRCPKYELFRPTFTITLAAFVGDIEQILGYMSYFITTLEAGEVLARGRCERYAHDIELLTNQLVDNANDFASLLLMITQVGELNTMIMSAKDFIAPRYR
jgi:hypothetical protein